MQMHLFIFTFLMIIHVNSIRRRALDLLYGMCDVSNAKDIVEELLQVQTNHYHIVRFDLIILW